MEDMKEELIEKINNAETTEELEEIEKQIDELKEKVEEAPAEEKHAEEPAEASCDDKAEEKEEEPAESISLEEEKSLLHSVLDKKVKSMEERKMNKNTEYRNAFLKRLQGKALSEEEQRALTTSTSSAGYAIPTETLDRIEEVLKIEAPLYDEVERLNINGYLNIPVEDTVNDAS